MTTTTHDRKGKGVNMNTLLTEQEAEKAIRTLVSQCSRQGARPYGALPADLSRDIQEVRRRVIRDRADLIPGFEEMPRGHERSRLLRDEIRRQQQDALEAWLAARRA